jgi:uncharacterized protein YihD (DUF1040 family)
MRDPIRIDRIIEKLRRAWHANPDLRLGQLIENVTLWRGNIFNIEDDKLEAQLDEFIADRENLSRSE